MPTLFDANLLELLTATRAERNSPAARAGRILRKADRAAKKLRAGAGEAADAAPAEAAAKGEQGYFRFIRFDVRHGFFNRANGVCDALAIRPTAETRRRLALYGLLLNQRPDGFDILWSHALRDAALRQLAPLVDLLAEVPEGQRARIVEAISRQLFGQALFFTISSPDPLFANYTEIPNDHLIGGRPLLLSTHAARIREGEDHRAELVVDWQALAVRPAPALAPPAMAAPREPPQALFIDTLIAADVGPGADEHEALETGSRQFALLDLHLVRRPGMVPVAGQWDGMPISLDPGADEPESRGGGIFHPCTYTLDFAARRTRWRYVVARRDGTAPDTRGLAVVEPGGGDAGFELTGKRTLPDGRTAACLSSKAALPILARPQRALSLIGTAPGGRARSATLVDRLPVAGTASILPDAAAPPPRAGEPPPAWSDIYVFV